jgi:hypothetical protein
MGLYDRLGEEDPRKKEEDEKEKEPTSLADRIKSGPSAIDPEPKQKNKSVQSQHVIDSDTDFSDVAAPRINTELPEKITSVGDALDHIQPGRIRKRKREQDPNISDHERRRLEDVQFRRVYNKKTNEIDPFLRESTFTEDLLDTAKAPLQFFRRLEISTGFHHLVDPYNDEDLNRKVAGHGGGRHPRTRRDEQIEGLAPRDAWEYRKARKQFTKAYKEEFGKDKNPSYEEMAEFGNTWLKLKEPEMVKRHFANAASIDPKRSDLKRGIVTEAVHSVFEFAPAMVIGKLTTIPGPVNPVSYGLVHATIYGASVEQNMQMQEQLGMSNFQAVHDGASLEAILSGPVEYADQLFKMKLIGTLGKATLQKMGIKVGTKGIQQFTKQLVKNKALKAAGVLSASAFFGAGEEGVQEEFGLMGAILAMNPDASREEQKAKYFELRQTDWFKDQQIQATKMGGLAGLMFGGVPGTLGVLMQKPEYNSRFITEGQKKANEARKVVEAQDIMASDGTTDGAKAATPDADMESTVETDGNGRIIIKRPDAAKQSEKEDVEIEGTPASQEMSKTGELLDDTDQSVYVQPRNLGGQTQTQDETAKAQNEAKADISSEQRGEMGIELHSPKAEAAIARDETLDLHIRDAFDAGDFAGAAQLAEEQLQNTETIQAEFTELLTAQDQKAKGQKKQANPQVQEALSKDIDQRTERAKKNQEIAVLNVKKKQEADKAAFIQHLTQPDTFKAAVATAQVQQKNRGNPEGSKLHERVLKELNRAKDIGSLDYLDKANPSKLSDLKTDLQQYRETLRPGTQEWLLVDQSIRNIQDTLFNKNEWDVKKGRDELADQRAIAAEKAKKEAAAKAKKATVGETPQQKAVRRARAGAAGKGTGPKDTGVGKGVTPATKKAQTDTQKKVADIKAKSIADRKAASERKSAIERQKKEVADAEVSPTTRANLEKAKSEARKERDAKDKAAHEAKVQKQREQNPDLTDTEIRKMEAEKGQTGTKLILQRLSPKGVRVDSLGQKGTTTPETHVQVTLTEGKAKGATINVPKKNFSQAVRDAVKSTQELFKALGNRIILNLDAIGNTKSFTQMVDALQRHVKLGKRSWLHKLAKAAGAKYHFIDGVEGLRKTDPYKRASQEEKQELEENIDGLGLFASGNGEMNIFINMKNVGETVTSVARMLDIVDHEALHAVVRHHFGKLGSELRDKVAFELRDKIWNKIPESMKVAKYDPKAGGWRIGNLLVKAEPNGIIPDSIRSIETGIRQTDGHIDEILTHGFTNPHFAKWLHSMESDGPEDHV